MWEQVRIDLFGGLTVQFGDRTLTRFRTRRTASVLAYLAINLGRAIPRAEIADAIWPESESSRHSLRMALTSLRKQLGDIFFADTNSVGIREGSVSCDVKQLLDTLDLVAKSEDLALLWDAVGRYKGRILPGFFDVWVLDLQEAIDRRVAEAALRLANAENARGAPNNAIRACNLVLGIDPTNTQATVMLAQLRSRVESPKHPSAGPKQLGTVAVLVTTAEVSEEAPGRLAAMDSKTTNRNGFVFCRASDAAKAALGHRYGLDCLEVGSDGVPDLRLADALYLAASTGQCLVSERAAVFLRNRSAFALDDLGLYRLPGIKRPQRVFQLGLPDTRHDFPPINAQPALTGTIPASFTRFIGRELEIADVVRHFGPMGGRLMTLVGPGGNGKTRLALEAVKALLDDFQGRIWFIPLADVSDDRAVASATLETLGIKPNGQTVSHHIAELAASHPALLVFDNAEQVVEGAASLIQEILVAAPKVKVLATSRIRLGLAGESIYPVMPLPVPAPSFRDPSPSVLLFVDRAQAVIPDFTLTPANEAAVTEICVRLEGIPLAIELAAARIRLYPPAQMLEQLDERLSFLRTNARGLPERQQTMRLAIEWSYRLLDERLQALFRRLSIFRSGWTTDAATAVCGATNDDLLQLLDNSLVTITDDGGQRFQMLETLREYAERELSDEERDETSGRHRDYFQEFVENASEKYRTPEEPDALLTIDPERENLAIALRSLTASEPNRAVRMALNLERFWEVRGHYREAHDVFRSLLDLSLHAKEQADGETAASLFAIHLGKLDEAQAMLEEAVGRYESLEDGSGLCTALWRLGNVRFWIGDYAAAAENYSRAERYAKGARALAILQHNLGNVRKELGDVSQARRYFESSITLSERLGDQRSALTSRFGLGALEETAGNVAAAEAAYEHCLRGFEQLGDPFNVALSSHFLGNLAAGRGDWSRARECFETSRAINEDIGESASLAANLFRLSTLYRRSGDTEAAIEAARESCVLLLRHGIRPELANALAKLAVAYQAGDLPDLAQKAFEAYFVVRAKTDCELDDEDAQELEDAMGALPWDLDPAIDASPETIAKSLGLQL